MFPWNQTSLSQHLRLGLHSLRPKLGRTSSSMNMAMEKKCKERKRKRDMGDARRKDKVEWPLIKPKKNLQFNHLKPNDLITVPNFLTSSESKAFIKFAESLGFAHQGSLGPAKGEAYRDNDRISVNDHKLADVVWESGLNKLFTDIKIRGKVAVGLNPNIRFYRYRAGQRFGRHIDESVDLADGKCTHYTLLIYLSGSSKLKGKSDVKSLGDAEPLVGGETVFYGSRSSVVAEVAPEEGMALVHIHGDKCMLHEARNVTKGVKSGHDHCCIKLAARHKGFFLDSLPR